MSASKIVQIPRYLVENDNYVNESEAKDARLYINSSNYGYVDKVDLDPLTLEHYYSVKNCWYEVDDVFTEFTLELTHKANQNIKLFEYKGDNKTHSNTTLYYSKSQAILYYWSTYSRRYINSPEQEDSQGYITSTVVKTKNELILYQNKKIMASWKTNTQFTSKDIHLLASNLDFKRFAFTPHVQLPVEMHYSSEDKIVKTTAVNLKMTNINDDVYSADSFSDLMVTDIISRGNWIYVKNNRGHVIAYSRPRGVDSGVTVTDVKYNYGTDEVTFNLDDGKIITLSVPTEENVEAIPVPSGTGILSSEGKHKPVFTEGNISLEVTKPKVKKVLFKPDLVTLTPVMSMISPEKISGPLDYSKRLLIKEIRDTNALNWPYDAANVLPDYESWIAFPAVQVTTSNIDIFDVREQGVIKLSPGEYVVRGWVRRNYNVPVGDVYGLRLTDGVEDVFCKLWNNTHIKKLVLNKGQLYYKINERVTISRESTLRLEELISGKVSPVNFLKYERFQQSEFEIFKI